MISTAFPGCCTARILSNLGGTGLSGGRKKAWTQDETRIWLQARIKDWRRHSCLVVMTNDQQKAVNKVLKELGFKHSDWMSKSQHPESKLKLWWKEP